MNNSTLIWLAGLGVLGIVVLLFINTIPMIWAPSSETYLKYNDIKGIAVEHKEKLYTLNFEQQNELIGYLNRSLPITDAKVPNKKNKLDISKIVIYQFKGPDLILTPIEYKNNSLIFSAPGWNTDLMKDTSGGSMQQLLSTTFDP